MEAKKPKKEDLPATLDFEPALAELETLVQKMEQGEMGLDEMVNAFERGQQLVRHCTDKLNEVERRIELLVKGPDGQATTKPFNPAE
jgi:exodeoxyribonuclease VII small subunit